MTVERRPAPQIFNRQVAVERISRNRIADQGLPRSGREKNPAGGPRSLTRSSWRRLQVLQRMDPYTPVQTETGCGMTGYFKIKLSPAAAKRHPGLCCKVAGVSRP